MIKKRMPIYIEKMKEEDLDEVLEIEKTSFYSPWSKKTFFNEINSSKLAIMLVARAQDAHCSHGIVGYACIWLIVDEFHITNFAVKPKFRRHGIGEQLIKYIVEMAREKRIKVLTLEVRESNLGAIRLYSKTGFHPVGLRKRYYSDTDEDALVMELNIRSVGK